MRDDQSPLRLDEQSVSFSSEPSLDVDRFGRREDNQRLSEVELEVGIREGGFGSVGGDVGWDEGGVGRSDVGVDWEKNEGLVHSEMTERRGEQRRSSVGVRGRSMGM